jgi:hypothetical protein
MKTIENLLEKEAAALQQLSVRQLKKVTQKSVFVFENKGNFRADLPDETEEMSCETTQIEQLSLRQLRRLSPKRSLSLADKVRMTGLSSEAVLRVETQKLKASLEEIMIYCTQLRIPFKAFLPELFVMV